MYSIQQRQFKKFYFLISLNRAENAYLEVMLFVKIYCVNDFSTESCEKQFEIVIKTKV